jgi:hypothetical protein
MADNGSRIPAWRRLGLALKNETQSGVAASEPSVSQDHLQPQSPYDCRNGSLDDSQTPIEPAVNGKTFKLGKRKHQHEPADENDQTTKRGKPSATEGNSNESTATDAPIIAKVESAKVHSASPRASSIEPSQPKGDPNYRKKKTKPNKNKRRTHDDIQVEPVPAPAQKESNHSHSSSLSPDTTTVPKKARRTLLASTELESPVEALAATPEPHLEASKGSNKDISGSPVGFDRRKSVTFTPDTKRVDGSSAQDLFKKWAAEQKGIDAEFADFASVSAPIVEVKEPLRTEKRQKEVTKSPAPPTTTPAASKGKKKDPSIYISYLTQYHNDHDHWKFNKAKQNDVVDNALNIFRISEQHSEALLKYVQGLKGAGVVQRLSEKCKATLKVLDKEDARDMSMDDAQSRRAVHDEALQARITKEQERRMVEGDVEGLVEHPYSDGYIRRLRRQRAEALLAALGRTAPILPATHTNSVNNILKDVAPVRDSKKRKRRGEVSSDESSSDSSSDSSSEEDSSSSESGSEDSDSESDSGSSAKSSDEGQSSEARADSGRSGSKSRSDSDRDSDSN